MVLNIPGEQPPYWSLYVQRLKRLTDPHAVLGAQLEYLEALFPQARVAYTPPGLAGLATEPRYYPDTEPQRAEGLPFRGESAILDDMLLVYGPRDAFDERHLPWLCRIRSATISRLQLVQTLPPDPDEHPVTRLGREALFHQCVRALSSDRNLVFHGLFLSLDGFSRRFPPDSNAQGGSLLRNVATLLRHTHPPRSALFHLSHAFFAVLSTGITRRQYRRSVWALRNLMLRRGFLPDGVPLLNISAGVISSPTDARFPGPFCDLLLSSLNKARKKRAHDVIFTEDWYRNPFSR